MGHLQGLVNNVACTPRDREEITEGIELQFDVKVLVYIWLTDELAEILKASAPPKITGQYF